MAHVVVLGSGFSGLCCAATLVDDGYRVTLVSAVEPGRTTSALAAAVWFPFTAGPAAAVDRWSRHSLSVLTEQARLGIPGVVLRETLTLYRHDPGTPDWVPAVGRVRPARPDELPPGYTHGLRFAVPLVEMPVHLPFLQRRLLDAGVTRITRSVDRLADLLWLHPDLVVNAAGLAAGKLVGDTSVYPVRGQIVRVRNPGLTMSVRDEAHPAGRAYVHPRADDAILGGTAEVGVFDTAPDPDTAAAILRRCIDIVPALAGAKILEHLVGLRPARPEIRLELDTGLLDVPVIHNYGHGGSGITVGWGCAQEVNLLARQVLPAAR